MAELTLFSAPKSFTNPHIAIIQHNAIQSWMQLGKQVDLILIGNEPGLAKVAAEYRLLLLSEVARNEQGTPLVSSIFSLARQASESPLLAYVNADILLFPDFLEAGRLVSKQVDRFLIIGQRWDLAIDQPIDYSPGWEQRLRSIIKAKSKLHVPAGSDFFIYPRTIFTSIPDFAIGRAGWDNWMIYHARKQGWSVVDTTPSLMVVHQSHDYSHLPAGKPHYNLRESDENLALAGGINRMYTVLDSDKQLINGKIRPPQLSLLRISRKIESWLVPDNHKREGLRWALARRLRRWRRKRTGSLV
jgi:hypothetical protein